MRISGSVACDRGRWEGRNWLRLYRVAGVLATVAIVAESCLEYPWSVTSWRRSLVSSEHHFFETPKVGVED